MSAAANRACMIAWIVTTYMNFVVQLAMIAIFLQLKTKERHGDVLVTAARESVYSVEDIAPYDESFVEADRYKNIDVDTYLEEDTQRYKSEYSTINSSPEDITESELPSRASKLRDTMATEMKTKTESVLTQAVDKSGQSKTDIKSMIIGQFVTSKNKRLN
jgi:hypothetical protein